MALERTLWRACDDGIIVGTAALAARREDAETYLSNPGYGGSSLWRADVTIDPARVLDLTEAASPLDVLVDLVGYHPGAIGAEEWAPQVSETLHAAGYDWVRVLDSYPVGCETWIWIGGDEDEPEMEEA